MTYSTALSMSRQRYSRRNQNTTTFKSSDTRLGPIASSVILVVLTCLLGIIYLIQVTHTNSLSYSIDNLQGKQQALIVEQEELEVDIARLQAIESVKQRTAVKDLVPAVPVTLSQ